MLFGDVSVGDKLKIGQHYGVFEDTLYSESMLTPMQNGDEWIFFLGHSPNLENSYWCVGDCDGRYPTKRSSENEIMTLSENAELGVYKEENFNWNIFNKLIEKYDV